MSIKIISIIKKIQNHLGRKFRFNKYYFFNGFAGNESISGEGSGDKQTNTLRNQLPKLLKKYNIKSMVDAPCGDNYWINKLNITNICYTGIDIVEVLIKKNISNYSNSKKFFICKDLVEYVVPKADLILCRDLLVHLTYKDSLAVLRNFKKSNSKYLLTTTFDQTNKNDDLLDKIWRPLNLELSPFLFPKPIYVINEKCSEENYKYKDKKLALWDLRSLQI